MVEDPAKAELYNIAITKNLKRRGCVVKNVKTRCYSLQ
jgi:hypothetical protein